MIPRIYWYAGGRYMLVAAEGDHSIFSVVMPKIEAGETPPVLTHIWMQTLLGISGKAEVCIGGGRWTRIAPLSELLVPGNTPHSFRNLDDAPAQFYVIARPGGFPHYLDQVAVKMPPEAYVQISGKPIVHRIEDWWIRGTGRQSEGSASSDTPGDGGE